MANGARTALCGAVDIAGWSRRPAAEQIFAQRDLIAVVLEALRFAWLPERIEQVSGDGALFVTPSGIDESRVVADLLYGLPLALRDRNADLLPAARLRLRFALSRGLLVPGPAGFSGDTVVTCFRLLDSTPVKAVLSDCPGREVATIISDVLFDDVARHGFPGLRPAEFQKVRCELPDKGFAGTAWLHLPGNQHATPYRPYHHL